MKEVVLIAHNIRSTHNIGSILRTADGLCINKVYLSGYSPYPKQKNEKRLPHIVSRLDYQINKTALGAQKSVNWEYIQNVQKLIEKLHCDEFYICAVEQSNRSSDIRLFSTKNKTALIVGREIDGLEDEVVEKCDEILEIPMLGKKESLNVAVAAAIAMYQCRRDEH